MIISIVNDSKHMNINIVQTIKIITVLVVIYSVEHKTVMFQNKGTGRLINPEWLCKQY